VFDVAVDLRQTSQRSGQWTGVVLSAENKYQLWVPEGFARGFIVMSEDAEFLYKTTDYWYPEDERTLLWNDPKIGIVWPLDMPPQLSSKDERGAPLAQAESYSC
jgi:dTDP-4-dehydrorhamnose 3,5-epimerase